MMQCHKKARLAGLFYGYCADTSFNPMIEAISMVIKNSRQKSEASLNKNIPIIAVPTAPMPVHTAYAVPIGIF